VGGSSTYIIQPYKIKLMGLKQRSCISLLYYVDKKGFIFTLICIVILGLWIKHGDRVRALNYDFGLNFGSPYICLDKFYVTPKVTIHLNNFVKKK
jgi:hypothetical protein